MTKHNLKLSSLIRGFILAGIMVSLSLIVKANKNKEVSSIAIQPAVLYIASDDAATHLSVQYDNKNKSKITVTIRDEAGNTMYHGSFTDAAFSKTFKVLNDRNDNPADLTLTVSVDNNREFVYQVKNTIDVVREIKVDKL